MAIIVPFGDPNAHGSLADSVTFRRIRGGVCFQKKPNPVIRYTPPQVAQRLAFTTANQEWYSYCVESKPFFTYRAAMLSLTARNLFARAYLLNQLPVWAQYNCDQILTGFLHNPTGRTFANTQINIYGWTSLEVLLGQFNCDTGLFFGNLPQGPTCIMYKVTILNTMAFGNYEGFTFNMLDQFGVQQTHTWRMPPGLSDPVYGIDLYPVLDDTLYTSQVGIPWLTTNKI